MCDTFYENAFKLDQLCNGHVRYSPDGNIVLRGKLISPESTPETTMILYWAANPPNFRSSFSGSGLPYPNAIVAYENTTNKGVANVHSDGTFEIRFRFPNAYYAKLGTEFIRPHLNIQVNRGKVYTVPLGEGVPFRFLTYPPSVPEEETIVVESAEQQLRKRGYPETYREYYLR